MKKAFTLAETLITLGIIGIVAALTIPTFVENYREKQIVVKLKKFYSTFSQAYQMAINDHGTIDTWELTDKAWTYDEDGKQTDLTDETYASMQKFFDIIIPYYKDNKSYMKYHTRYLLSDGTYMVGPNLSVSECAADEHKACGGFRVDLVWSSKVNQSFFFTLYKNKVVPYGLYQDKWWNDGPESIDRYGFIECLGNHAHCTAWVIYNENLDYLHCPDDIGWSKARSCKEAKKIKKL